jgi:hypothetical protein
MPDGVWINTKQALVIHSRKLAATTRSRITEETSGFRKLDAKQQAASGGP